MANKSFVDIIIVFVYLKYPVRWAYLQYIYNHEQQALFIGGFVVYVHPSADNTRSAALSFPPMSR